MSRWDELRASLRMTLPRFATAAQVHGTRVVEHDGAWEGWLRVPEADGHFVPRSGTALAVTIADCVPVFIAHPKGAIALLHSGWKGTAARIIDRALAAFSRQGLAAGELRIHLGPSICGKCYEVSAEVATALTGIEADTEPAASGRRHVDLRAIIDAHAREAGVTRITTSRWCTRCDNARFFSHRAGDAGRQLAIMLARTDASGAPARVDSP